MKTNPDLPRYQTNWGVRFLCDCRKANKEINIHKGIASEISSSRVSILSDHKICEQKKIAMQLLIPPLTGGAPQKIIKIVGKSLDTIKLEAKFLTEIEFQYFEENGLTVLENNLHQRFDRQFFERPAQQA